MCAGQFTAERVKTRMAVAVMRMAQPARTSRLRAASVVVLGHDRALVHDRDAVAEPFGLVEVVGGEHGGHAGASAQPADQVQQFIADAVSSPTVGSSRNSTRGSDTSARAISSRRRWPPL